MRAASRSSISTRSPRIRRSSRGVSSRTRHTGAHRDSASTPKRFSKRSDFSPHLADLTACFLASAVVVDYEIGEGAFAGDRHLRGEHRARTIHGDPALLDQTADLVLW